MLCDEELIGFGLRGAALEAIKKIKKFKFEAGGNHANRCIKIWIDPPDYKYFTSIVHNKIIRAASLYYGGIVLMEYRYTRRVKENEKGIPGEKEL